MTFVIYFGTIITANPSELNAVTHTMNTLCDISNEILLATARVQAALELIPCMVGPKEVWARWMMEKLKEELVSNPISVFLKLHVS